MIRKLKSEKTFRYVTFGDIEKASTLIYVLHGYGQLAPYFIKKFHSLPSDYFIVAPEGMHRFYLNGNSGRVGASWMTKEEREDDIADNIQWLNTLHKEIININRFKKSILLGFSQGGATAARWQKNGIIHADHLIIWASVFPPDLNPEYEIHENQSKHFFFIGNNDEYYSAEQQIELLSLFKSKGFKTIHYEGEHQIKISELRNVLLQIS